MVDQPTTIRPGEALDQTQLAAFLHRELGLTGPLEVRQFPSGFSNLTYLVRMGGRELVLRRPPMGANIKSAHDMAREHRLLVALHPVYPLVPQPVAYCADPEVIGAEFYLMERVEGLILRQRPPQDMELTPVLMRQIAEAAVATLAQLHQTDLQATGLLALGKPEGYVQRQVEGWIGRYRNAQTETVPGLELAAEWLPAQQPAGQAPALIHNDYKYDNLVLDPDQPGRVKAVLDWEMATIGDPLMDLGTTLAYWADPDSPEVLKGFSLTARPGNLSRQEVLERYGQLTDRSLAHFPFYYTFGCLKVAVICQQIYARYQRGLTQDARFAGLIHLVRAFGQLCEQTIHTGRISNWG
ncbi:MAG: phosphotransferase family protein [Bernardetiaceae bacterium]|nr:phosphotransferase family protein [Bernardetiaceae bacterium]